MLQQYIADQNSIKLIFLLYIEVNEAIIDWDTENEKIWKCYYFKREQMGEHKLTKQNLHC